MTWREDLRRITIGGRELIGASFRGVPFLVESSERSGGRRVVVHEFPLRDQPFAEDLGKRAGVFRLDAYVIGDDYLAQRDALLTALEDTAGPGELVHPYHGIRRAICVTLGVREVRSDGGMAAFSLEFQETPAQAPVPVTEIDSVGQVADGANKAATATDTEFQERFHPEGLPSFALASASAALTAATNALGAALAPAASAEGAVQELAGLTGKVAALTQQATALVRAPAELLGLVRFVITDLVDTTLAAPGAVMRALTDAYGVDMGPDVAETTATRVRERANQIAIVDGLRRVMAVEAARLAPLVPYDSIEAANAARDTVAALLQEQATSAGDTAYPALVNLRSDVMRAIPGNTAFARIIRITLRTPIPSLLLAHRLYGSVNREPDIIARNGISHPGFVSGDLRVLSDA